MPRTRLAYAVLAISSLGAVYLCLDPALQIIEMALGSTRHYLMRNESVESLQSLTGRTELWSAVWVEALKAPLHGCGYFVTSQNGLLDVWSGPANRTAHNFALQVFVSTGLIGLLLFAWGLGRIARCAARNLPCSAEGRQLGKLLLVLACWYAGWSQLCASFMGPIQPESIVFFCCLGLSLAGYSATAEQPSSCRCLAEREIGSGVSS
jgi:O-antigen ligase